MHARFYAPDAHAAGDLIDLPDEEAQHLTRVLRLSAGDPIEVFNGRGQAFAAAVESASKVAVRVRLGQACPAAREAGVGVTLAQAVLKGDKMDDVVRDAVMMGVSAIQPIITVRTEVARGALERGHRRERWERIAISSAKQCGRAVVPRIYDPQPFGDVMKAIGDLRLTSPAFMFVEPGASADVRGLREIDWAPVKEATVVIGPEGGWTREEIEAGESCCRLVTLGGRTLRADAMAVVALSALYALCAEY